MMNVKRLYRHNSKRIFSFLLIVLLLLNYFTWFQMENQRAQALVGVDDAIIIALVASLLTAMGLTFVTQQQADSAAGYVIQHLSVTNRDILEALMEKATPALVDGFINAVNVVAVNTKWFNEFKAWVIDLFKIESSHIEAGKMSLLSVDLTGCTVTVKNGNDTMTYPIYSVDTGADGAVDFFDFEYKDFKVYRGIVNAYSWMRLSDVSKYYDYMNVAFADSRYSFLGSNVFYTSQVLYEYGVKIKFVYDSTYPGVFVKYFMRNPDKSSDGALGTYIPTYPKLYIESGALDLDPDIPLEEYAIAIPIPEEKEETPIYVPEIPDIVGKIWTDVIPDAIPDNPAIPVPDVSSPPEVINPPDDLPYVPEIEIPDIEVKPGKINFKPLVGAFAILGKFFPFSLPFEFIRMIKSFDMTRVAPKFSFNWTFTLVGRTFTWPLTFDLSIVEPIMPVVRFMILTGFIVFLIGATRRLTGW